MKLIIDALVAEKTSIIKQAGRHRASCRLHPSLDLHQLAGEQTFRENALGAGHDAPRGGLPAQSLKPHFNQFKRNGGTRNPGAFLLAGPMKGRFPKETPERDLRLLVAKLGAQIVGRENRRPLAKLVQPVSTINGQSNTALALVQSRQRIASPKEATNNGSRGTGSHANKMPRI